MSSGDYSWPTSGRHASSYEPDRQTAAFRAALAAADTPFTTAGILGTPEFKVLGRPTIVVGARFSASGQTCKVQIVYVYKRTSTGATDGSGSATDTSVNTIKGWSDVITLTGGTVQKEGTYYEAPDYFFDSEGAVTARILLIAAPASGTVDLWAGSQ